MFRLQINVEVNDMLFLDQRHISGAVILLDAYTWYCKQISYNDAIWMRVINYGYGYGQTIINILVGL